MSSSTDQNAFTWRPKAIVFDLLTALLDSWSLWDASTPSKSSEEGRTWRARYLEITFGTGAYVPYEDLVRQAACDVGLPDSAPTALLRDWTDLEAWPDVAEVLSVLRAKGYKLGVVTNCSKRLGRIAAQKAGKGAVKGSGNDAFDAVITAEESGFYKPTREAYMAILNSMGYEPDDVLFVAGSAGDVEGATNAGMRVVWHNKVGLTKKGRAVPLKESSTLKDTLSRFLE
jgi:2-haloacid dehalogenase